MQVAEGTGTRPEELSLEEPDWRSMLADQQEQARELIRAHPVIAVVGAAALGFLIARLVREE